MIEQWIATFAKQGRGCFLLSRPIDDVCLPYSRASSRYGYEPACGVIGYRVITFLFRILVWRYQAADELVIRFMVASC